MINLRIICPKCGHEESYKSEVSNIYEYKDSIEYKQCDKCKKKYKNSPEEKLLRAIFGDEE